MVVASPREHSSILPAGASRFGAFSPSPCPPTALAPQPAGHRDTLSGEEETSQQTGPPQACSDCATSIPQGSWGPREVPSLSSVMAGAGRCPPLSDPAPGIGTFRGRDSGIRTCPRHRLQAALRMFSHTSQQPATNDSEPTTAVNEGLTFPAPIHPVGPSLRAAAGQVFGVSDT